MLFSSSSEYILIYISIFVLSLTIFGVQITGVLESFNRSTVSPSNFYLVPCLPQTQWPNITFEQGDRRINRSWGLALLRKTSLTLSPQIAANSESPFPSWKNTLSPLFLYEKFRFPSSVWVNLSLPSLLIQISTSSSKNTCPKNGRMISKVYRKEIKYYLLTDPKEFSITALYLQSVLGEGNCISFSDQPVWLYIRIG